MDYWSPIGINDTIPGKGRRVQLFVCGCKKTCPTCDESECVFTQGVEFTDEVLEKLLELAENDDIEGLAILGGEPLVPDNQPEIAKIVTAFKKRFPYKNVCIFTGYTLEENLDPSRPAYTNWTPVILENTDILVDGPIVKGQRYIYLKDGSPYKVENK